MGVHFNPNIEVFYTYSGDSTLRHASGVSPAHHEFCRNDVLSLSSPCTSTKSILLGSPSNPSSSATRFPHTSSKSVDHSEHRDVPSHRVAHSTGSKSAPVERPNSGGELSKKDLKNYDSTGLHIAFSSKLELLDYDISQSPENENSIAETEAVSPYLDKPATRDQSCKVGIQYPALPVIIWIKVPNGYITVLDVFHGLYAFMMSPPLNNWMDYEPVERKVYIEDARDTRIKKSRCMDRGVKWIDWMPRNRRIIRLSKGPECRKYTWMMSLEGDTGE
ncbi:hypothetical protein C0992_009533 [Termitomyces sp. T32_za158]|nr:hypothetical protein C0992_009533 [Termitomyces sp. T32_za158]